MKTISGVAVSRQASTAFADMRCGEGMGGVDHRADVFRAQEIRETRRAAEAADPLRDRGLRRMGGRAGERQERVDGGLAGEAAGEGARFRRAAENEQAKAFHEAAP